jgi:RNA polymerase sigma-70 factor, ECF subfamily
MDPPQEDVAQLLLASRQGDAGVVDRLLPILYEELRRLARHYLSQESTGHTLQTTALVHEASLRLAGADLDGANRQHFFALAAQVMRRVLVDHARTRHRARRGGAPVQVPLEGLAAVSAERPDEFLALDEALERLSALDHRKARIVELLYFGGLNYEETAALLGISSATVHRDLRLARAWLFRELSGDRPTNG